VALGRAIPDEVIEEERPGAIAVPLARLRRLSSRRRDTGGRLMAPPLVSAVTIVRDGERFLEKAIDSVLRQTYRNLELVVVDDGSTDRSAEIAARFVRADPDRVRLVRHADGSSRGMSAARTLGVEAARGELFGFLDADDIWLPDKLAEQVAVLDAHPAAGMVYSPHADVARLGRERDAQRLLLRPRRHARPTLPAARAATAAAREPRPVPDDVQRPRAPRGVRGGGRVRDAVLRPL
jgi:glycosyltransferase involved in cell wall biosynthesis